MSFTISDINRSNWPSLSILEMLYEYDDFMMSIATLVDLGCGQGKDLQWWATRTTRDKTPIPLNIQCVGVDTVPDLAMAREYQNVTYQKVDFETTILTPKNKFDVLWAYNSFQYCIDPLKTLVKWRDIASEGAMLVISIPQTTNFKQHEQDIKLESGAYYHHSIVSLIYMLATTGWDCKSGFYQKHADSNTINLIVYKSDREPLDPKTTTWIDLFDKDILPESAAKSVYAHGYLQQRDLVLPWLDHSLTWFAK